ncbi:MAG TPA: protein phosphatase 2C domain-containing protein [Bacteroidota bacterium]|nr:protein phosphatase 2C domain-containing protein [Bacteroidota bacterium]
MTDSEIVEIESYSYTHMGNVREDNQDAVRLCDPVDNLTFTDGHLYGIADGMGGYAHGGVASALALETFFETFYAANGVPPSQKLRVGVQNANLSVYQTAQRLGAGRMGTTLTAVNIVGNKLHIAHIGDSRAYLIREQKSKCLTNDHTRVGELVRMKVLSPEKVRTHSQRSMLDKCLGMELFVQPDIFQVQAKPGDIIVLCSDGVWATIQDDEFADIISQSKDREHICKKIVDLAMERGSDDNLSMILLYLHRLAPSKAEDEKSSFWTLPQAIRRLFK